MDAVQLIQGSRVLMVMGGKHRTSDGVTPLFDTEILDLNARDKWVIKKGCFCK